MSKRQDYLQDKAERIRLKSLEMTTAVGSGHPTTAMSAAEILSVLYFDRMIFDPANANSLEGDDFVMSKGHGAPGLYAAMDEAGMLAGLDIMDLRSFESALEGHPVPRIAGVRLGTGSLGQGLSGGLGLALAMKLDKIDRHVYVLLGDGEMAEGNVWEAINLAPVLGTDNLIGIIDVNRLGQSQPTVYEWDTDSYKNKLEAFGWRSDVVDGHSTEELSEALTQARQTGGPSMVIARTVKGKGADFLENKEDRHGKAISQEELEQAKEQIRARFQPVDYHPQNWSSLPPMPEIPEGDGRIEIQTNYSVGESEATRTAYGKALASVGQKDKRVVVLDGDVKGSTRTKFFFKGIPERAIECYIAEQNMVAVAAGLQARGKRPHVATFAAFLTRAHDQIRMAAYSRARINLAGSHTGVSIGEDGPSQMGLEDEAMMRAVINSVVVSPADAVSAEKLVGVLNGYHGISYLRTIRGKTPVIYDNDERFEIGGSKLLRSSASDQALLVAAGITVSEALEAYELLSKDGVTVAVMDAYSLKPIDTRALQQAASAVPFLLTVEDHFPEGGLAEAVAAAVGGKASVYSQAVTRMPHSGGSAQLMAEQGIDAAGIADRVRALIAESS